MPRRKKSTVTETSEQIDKTAQLAETEQPASVVESTETEQAITDDEQPDEVEQPANIEESAEAEQTTADEPPEETDQPAAVEESAKSVEATEAPLEQFDSIGVPDEATIKSFEANVESAESTEATAGDAHTTEEVSSTELGQSNEAAFLTDMEESKHITVYEVADVDEEEYTETPYSRLSKLDKYRVSYALWNDCTPKSPAIRRILKYLSHLIFFYQQLKKKRNDKELKADIESAEKKLADEYEAMFGGMFQQGAWV